MTKRDTIQRVILKSIDDEQGGTKVEKEYKEIIKAHVSVNATANELTQYGVKTEILLHVITNIKLDEYVKARYEYSGKMFKLMRQIKQGNEYFSVMIETNN